MPSGRLFKKPGIIHIQNDKKMEKDLRELSDAMNEMVVKGQLVEAAEKYYAPNIRTVEFDGRFRLNSLVIPSRSSYARLITAGCLTRSNPIMH